MKNTALKALRAGHWAVAPLMALGLQASAVCQSLNTSDDAPARQGWHPSTLFVQAGHASDTSALGLGASWNWDWRRDHALGTVTGLWELSASRWHVDNEAPGRGAWFTQVNITPALRLYPHSWSPGWFVEGGIGVSSISPRYRTRTKTFGTEFNFNEHLAIGKRLGEHHELSLRAQHVSNAGIKQPNPGETFLQLRYACVF